MTENGEAGTRFWRESLRSSIAQRAESAEEVLGMVQLCEEKSTVLAMHSASIAVTYTW